jgi:hypothetical protein
MIFQVFPFAPPVSQNILTKIRSSSDKPRLFVFFAFEDRSGLYQLKEGILNSVFGIGCILHVGKAHAVYCFLMALVDFHNFSIRTQQRFRHRFDLPSLLIQSSIPKCRIFFKIPFQKLLAAHLRRQSAAITQQVSLITRKRSF